MRLGSRGWISFRALGRVAALAALVFSLGACASAMQMMTGDVKPEKQVKVEEAPSTPVVLRSVPRYVQYAPVDEWVYLWDRPGGPSARAVRVARVPSGTAGVMVESEPPRPLLAEFLRAINADTTNTPPVNWVKVKTRRGDGWVRVEFVEVR